MENVTFSYKNEVDNGREDMPLAGVKHTMPGAMLETINAINLV